MDSNIVLDCSATNSNSTLYGAWQYGYREEFEIPQKAEYLQETLLQKYTSHLVTFKDSG